MDMSGKKFAEYADKVVDTTDQARALKLVQQIYDEGLKAQQWKDSAAMSQVEHELAECRRRLEDAGLE